MKKRVAIACLFTLTLLVPTACNNAAKDIAGNQAETEPAVDVAELHSESENASNAESNVEAVVSLTIEFGDGAKKRFPAIPWEQDMTVFDTLEWAADQPDGIRFEHRGQGALALVDQIDDLKNGGGNGKNWIFRVNGKLANSSCGVSRIAAGDEISWKFDVYQ